MCVIFHRHATLLSIDLAHHDVSENKRNFSPVPEYCFDDCLCWASRNIVRYFLCSFSYTNSVKYYVVYQVLVFVKCYILKNWYLVYNNKQTLIALQRQELFVAQLIF